MIRRKKPPNNSQEQLKHLQSNIKKYGKDFTYPPNLNFTRIKTNSWFDMYMSEEHNLFKTPQNIVFDEPESDGFTTRQLELYFTDDQKKIINVWLDMWILMYNCTIKYIKTQIFDNKKVSNIKTVKKLLANDKAFIKEKSKLSTIINGKLKITHIDSHCLDYAINDALNMYKGNMTKIEKGLISSFTLRYIKLTKPQKILKLEKLAFRENTFCMACFGKTIECSIKNFNYEKNIKTVATIIKKKDKYYLLLKYQKHTTNKKWTLDMISIDPGIRTVMTGYSNNFVLKIGENVQNEIEKKLRTIDRIKQLGHSNRKIRKKYEKIKNMINDMHWKASKYLVTNFETILIGNLSTKRMGEQKMNTMTKRIGNMISFYEFKKKLIYMCEHTGTKYKETDEGHTTKCCEVCGFIKKDVGSNKIYKCDKCKINKDRDIHSAINIMISSLKK